MRDAKSVLVSSQNDDGTAYSYSSLSDGRVWCASTAKSTAADAQTGTESTSVNW